MATFFTLPNQNLPKFTRPYFTLNSTGWDDWFKFETQFLLSYHREDGSEEIIGAVKIAHKDLRPGKQAGPGVRKTLLPPDFAQLPEHFYSLGQDDSYYSKLNDLGEDVREAALIALNDVAYDTNLFDRHFKEPAMGISLLRFVPPATVRGQYNRLAHGGLRLSAYSFEYTLPPPADSLSPTASLTFEVEPNSLPPTNVHVLIGRNGVGKTHILHRMSLALADIGIPPTEVGRFGHSESDFSEDAAVFANLVLVSFSAFDTFVPLQERQAKNHEGEIGYVYVGLKVRQQSRQITRTQDSVQIKPPSGLAREFSQAFFACHTISARRYRLQRALEMLQSDPTFADIGIADIARDEDDPKIVQSEAQSIFSRLSSGHKIVLLTVTRLVLAVEERSLVLIDEPEAHLHPPLLSAFIRSLSDLLVDRNGVAIVATHSPVVLQEVPRNCVWKIRRAGRTVFPERPEIETFGENVGTLTREVFGLEVSHSGFHRLLAEAALESRSYDEVVEQFGDSLGGEARAVLRALIVSLGGKPV